MTPKRYVLHPACRVRQEQFGLLFYDLRGPRLLFANTGDTLRPDQLTDGGGVAAALECLPPDRKRQVEGFLNNLVEKGFLREQPVC